MRIFVKSTPHVVLEGDSQVLMTALVNYSTFFSLSSLLIDNVRFSSRLFIQLRYSHAKKEDNKVAYN